MICFALKTVCVFQAEAMSLETLIALKLRSLKPSPIKAWAHRDVEDARSEGESS